MNVVNLQRQQTVFIHSVAGGAGQAAIMISQHIGAEIFVTAGGASKRELITKHYEIPDSQIFSSRSSSFKMGIMRLTKDLGVDIVLNSLSGEALTETWGCIAGFEIFTKIDKTDIYRNSHISM